MRLISPYCLVSRILSIQPLSLMKMSCNAGMGRDPSALSILSTLFIPSFLAPIYQICPLLDDVSVASWVCTHTHTYIQNIYHLYIYIHTHIYPIYPFSGTSICPSFSSDRSVKNRLDPPNLEAAGLTKPPDPYGPCCLANQYIHPVLTSQNLTKNSIAQTIRSAPIYPNLIESLSICPPQSIHPSIQ